jgi:hypothetical protein
LKLDGRVLFLEHGLSDEPKVATWQHRLNPMWRQLAVGCNLNRPIAPLLEGAGFAIRSIDRHYLDGAPRPLGFLCQGVAEVA